MSALRSGRETRGGICIFKLTRVCLQLSRLGGAAPLPLLLLGSAILCGNARVDRVPRIHTTISSSPFFLAHVRIHRRTRGVIDSATVIVIAPTNSRRGRFFVPNRLARRKLRRRANFSVFFFLFFLNKSRNFRKPTENAFGKCHSASTINPL